MAINAQESDLNRTFAALADPTRRAILLRLAAGEATVAELSEPFALRQPTISKHLKVLEQAGLIEKGRDAQRRPRKLTRAALQDVSGWVEDFRKEWTVRLDRLEAHLARMKPKET